LESPAKMPGFFNSKGMDAHNNRWPLPPAITVFDRTEFGERMLAEFGQASAPFVFGKKTRTSIIAARSAAQYRRMERAMAPPGE
jgi:hypothetical protein